MFIQVYKSTIKNIVRSKLFISVLLLIFGIIIYKTVMNMSGVVLINPTTGEMKSILKTDLRYSLDYGTYVQGITNTVRGTLSSYLSPILSILTAVIVLRRDTNDNFFEIEKGYGAVSIRYAISKISAIITVNLAIVTITSFFAFHFYIFSLGGMSKIGVGYYIIDSTIRLLRVILFIAYPCSLIYTTLTYMVGSLLKSELFAAIIASSYLLFSINPSLKRIIPEVYYDYFTHVPSKTGFFWLWYDTYDFERVLEMHEVTIQQVYLCYAWFAVLILTCIIVSCIAVKKRHL